MKRKPRKSPGEKYTVESYGKAIKKGCEKADKKAHQDNPQIPAEEIIVHEWHPNQLRHNFATDIRKRFGLEAAKVILGHQQITTTQIYAEQDREASRKVIGEVG